MVFPFLNKIVYFVLKAFSYVMRKLSERTPVDLCVNFFISIHHLRLQQIYNLCPEP